MLLQEDWYYLTSYSIWPYNIVTFEDLIIFVDVIIWGTMYWP